MDKNSAGPARPPPKHAEPAYRADGSQRELFLPLFAARLTAPARSGRFFSEVSANSWSCSCLIPSRLLLREYSFPGWCSAIAIARRCFLEFAGTDYNLVIVMYRSCGRVHDAALWTYVSSTTPCCVRSIEPEVAFCAVSQVVAVVGVAGTLQKTVA